MNRLSLLFCVALSLPLLAQAEADNGCTFSPPSARLQGKAYPGQSFRREKDNRAVESAQIAKDLQLQIRSSQCVDFIETEIALTLPRGARNATSLTAWLALARSEIARLKTVEKDDNAELLAFLAMAHTLVAHGGKLSACRDGTRADAGMCSWDSTGGFIFEFKETPSALRLVATKYVSG